MISNSGHDENGRYTGGVAGDLTGTEWEIRSWYNRPWNCVIRHPDKTVREKIAEIAEKAAKNDKIGYDQNQRYTYWEHLAASNYDPSQITVACESDCSAGVLANVKAAGYQLGNEKLKNVSIYGYTGNMREILSSAGFEVLYDSKYLTGDSYLYRGDILLNIKSHTATNLTTGKNAGGDTPTPSGHSTLKKGDSGSEVTEMQNLLLKRGYDLGKYGADGQFGSTTEKAVKKFQTNNGLTSDGICGPLTWAALDKTEPTPTPSYNKYSRVDIVPYKNNKTVCEIQTCLCVLGYYDEALLFDGVYGQGTFNAITKFLEDYNLGADGYAAVNGATWNKIDELMSGKHATIEKGFTGKSVYDCQSALNYFGYKDSSLNYLTEDGDFGSGTDYAVKQLQSDYNLGADGKMAYYGSTWKKIDELYTKVEKMYVNTSNSSLNVRKGRGTNYPVVDTIAKGTWHTCTNKVGGWGYLHDVGGWASLEYLK